MSCKKGLPGKMEILSAQNLKYNSIYLSANPLGFMDKLQQDQLCKITTLNQISIVASDFVHWTYPCDAVIF